MTGGHEPLDDSAARARRGWIMVHHPDHGGDPETFAAGLAAALWLDSRASEDSEVRVRAYRRRGPGAVLGQMARTCHRARARYRVRRRSRHRRVI